jgi:xanthine dehydrogenase YagS FAD-binding subunit
VLGHVAPTPWRATEAEKVLAGKGLSAAVIQKAAEAAVTGATPLSRNGYKVQLVRAAVRRALEAARPKA